MAEYIEKEALQNALQRKKSGVADRRYTEGWNDCLLRVKSIVHGVPAADVAPVVRCADCLFCNDYADSEGNAHLYCTRCNCCLDVDPTDFCSYGERKGG